MQDLRFALCQLLKSPGFTAAAVLTLALGRLLQSKLVGVPLGDPLVYVGVPALLLAVAFVAYWLPARRATRVDPSITLRAE